MTNTKFKKGNIPWNKGKKGIRLSPKSEFKKGQTAGSRSNTWKGGIQAMKNDCVYLYEGVGKRKRRPRKIYEDYYGKIPKGYIVHHIDGDRYNDNIDNLQLLSRADLLKKNIL